MSQVANCCNGHFLAQATTLKIKQIFSKGLTLKELLIGIMLTMETDFLVQPKIITLGIAARPCTFHAGTQYCISRERKNPSQGKINFF